MAQIKHYPVAAHLRGAPSAQQLLWKGGKLRRSGRGLSFWFQPLSANLAEIPLDDRELAFIFHSRTADFQEAVCQGTISYRVGDPEAATGPSTATALAALIRMALLGHRARAAEAVSEAAR